FATQATELLARIELDVADGGHVRAMLLVSDAEGRRILRAGLELRRARREQVQAWTRSAPDDLYRVEFKPIEESPDGAVSEQAAANDSLVIIGDGHLGAALGAPDTLDGIEPLLARIAAGEAAPRRCVIDATGAARGPAARTLDGAAGLAAQQATVLALA